jgi:hypothetical protein
VKRFLFFLLLLFTFSSIKSQAYDSLQVSLLTVAPHSKAVWTFFGHTALRLHDPAQKIDWVFNWGTFDNSRPNFIFRFIQGKTDYFLNYTSFESFIPVYVYDKVEMTEQILNIPDSEKENLLNFLQINLLPQNIEYRYNFVFDNCTTRPRDIIEQFCGGTLIYPEQTQVVTFRQLFHQYTRPYPWLELGIDCIIGSGADSLITYRHELFLPEKLMDALNRSVVKLPTGDEQPVVLASGLILRSPDPQPERLKFWEHPFEVGWVVFTLYLALIIVGFFKKYRFRLPFALLFFVAGAGGCIVAMLQFFSLHPCVQSNWNILWLHPLHFIACAGFFFRKSYRLIRWYHAVNFVLLSCFLLGWHWIPQELNKAFIPIILCLWVVSGLQAVILKQKKK